MTDSHNTQPLSGRELAQACVDAMYAKDKTANALGITIQVEQLGAAIAHMTVREDMTNGHGICHGGMLFTLADTCFAYASNNSNRNTVAAACSIDFIAPAMAGDRLTASACQRMRGRRNSLYDVEIHNQRAELIALFRGKGYQIHGTVIPSSGEIT